MATGKSARTGGTRAEIRAQLKSHDGWRGLASLRDLESFSRETDLCRPVDFIRAFAAYHHHPEAAPPDVIRSHGKLPERLPGLSEREVELLRRALVDAEHLPRGVGSDRVWSAMLGWAGRVAAGDDRAVLDEAADALRSAEVLDLTLREFLSEERLLARALARLEARSGLRFESALLLGIAESAEASEVLLRSLGGDGPTIRILQDEAPSVDDDGRLIALVRAESRTPEDAKWGVSQLARLGGAFMDRVLHFTMESAPGGDEPLLAVAIQRIPELRGFDGNQVCLLATAAGEDGPLLEVPIATAREELSLPNGADRSAVVAGLREHRECAGRALSVPEHARWMAEWAMRGHPDRKEIAQVVYWIRYYLELLRASAEMHAANRSRAFFDRFVGAPAGHDDANEWFRRGFGRDVGEASVAALRSANPAGLLEAVEEGGMDALRRPWVASAIEFWRAEAASEQNSAAIRRKAANPLRRVGEALARVTGPGRVREHSGRDRSWLESNRSSVLKYAQALNRKRDVDAPGCVAEIGVEPDRCRRELRRLLESMRPFEATDEFLKSALNARARSR